jgi:hypothetical protein
MSTVSNGFGLDIFRHVVLRKEFDLMKIKAVYFALILMISGALTGASANIMPNFANLPAGWTTDRYEPASFSNIGTYQGHSNVLGISIDASTGQFARPLGQQGLFYATQGRKFTFTPVQNAGSSLTADLFIPASWGDSSQGHVRTDMWGTMVDSASAISAYPIIGFTNYGGLPRYRVWDGAAWIDLGDAVTFDTWTNFKIELLADSSINFYLNGNLVFADTSTNGSVAFKEVIMQAYNFDHTDIAGEILAPYTAYWSNAVAANADQCKNGGWRSLFRSNGSAFKNQGDCIQYVNTGR